jgi:hypothetical protein
MFISSLDTAENAGICCPYSVVMFRMLTASFVSGVLCGYLDVHERAGPEHHPAGGGEPPPPHRGHLQAKSQNIISNI